MIGTTVSRYKVVSKLGGGGMGVVSGSGSRERDVVHDGKAYLTSEVRA